MQLNIVSICNGLKARAGLLDSASQLAYEFVTYAFWLGAVSAFAALVAFCRGAYLAQVDSE